MRTSNLHTADIETQVDTDSDVNQDPELKLPKTSSLAIIIALNVMSQVTMFLVVPSANKYAEYLGGSATFAGLVLGIPVVFAGIALPPLMKIDQGRYSRPIHISCATAVIGHILYGLAYYANFLWLILIGRSVIGLAMSNFMYSKRYCSDTRIVGIRRRSTLAGWLVIGQGIGFSVGPFAGGLLYKIGFGNRVFNGYTSPGWIMAALWLVYWAVFTKYFEDVPLNPPKRFESPAQVEEKVETKPYAARVPDPIADESAPSTTVSASSSSTTLAESMHVTKRQWAVIVTMCWFAMTCFYTLSAWESNVPVFTASKFGWSPFASGNFIALGGITTFPLLFLNMYLVRRIQDRYVLAFGSGVGLCGLLITILIIHFDKVSFGSFFVCWFLVALGFNIASTVTMSLLSKQLPPHWNGGISLAIQYSNFSGRVSGSVWGGAGVQVGMLTYLGVELALLGVGGIMILTLWREMRAKKG